jgi:beta-lactam-binding protein with PASTA domain
VIVPKVLSLPQSDATSAISARGLVPTVSFSKKCINPGDVLTQNPAAGVLVARGSTVHITVDNGTPSTCRDIQ